MGNDAKKRRLDEPTDLPLPCQPCVIALPALGVAQGGRKAAGPTTATTPRPAPTHTHPRGVHSRDIAFLYKTVRTQASIASIGSK